MAMERISRGTRTLTGCCMGPFFIIEEEQRKDDGGKKKNEKMKPKTVPFGFRKAQ